MLRPRNPNPHRMWTEERLRSSPATFFSGESIVVPANREPDRHDRSADGSVGVRRSSGGPVTTLEPLIQACSGVWVAHGSGTADVVAKEFVAARDDLESCWVQIGQLLDGVRTLLARFHASSSLRIRLPAMSRAWLRTHEHEYDKHSADV